MTAVAIVDYRLCNLDSIRRAIEECGGRPIVVRDPQEIGDTDRIVLPGVGSFARAMANLEAAGFVEALREAVIANGRPLLGVCLGMQLLGQTGSEGGETKGLGLLRGRVERMNPANAQKPERIPHIGWNDVAQATPSALFEGIAAGTDFYFVHSYRLESPPEETLAVVDYCGRTVAAAGRGNVMAVQFHPEKSQVAGLRLLKNFLERGTC